jgi:hypothetical protein
MNCNATNHRRRFARCHRRAEIPQLFAIFGVSAAFTVDPSQGQGQRWLLQPSTDSNTPLIRTKMEETRMRILKSLSCQMALSALPMVVALTSIAAVLQVPVSIANAGTSAEDPVVKSLREDFSEAVSPTLADLRENQTWQCREFHALQGDFTVGQPFDVRFNFYHGNLVELHTSAATEILAISGKGLVGEMHDSGQRLYFRTAANGDLMGELLLRANQTNAGQPSISEPFLNAYTYILCPSDKIEN